jgi:hypothetical protein
MVLLLAGCAATAPAVEAQVAPQIDLSLEGTSAPVELDGMVCLQPDLVDALDTQREQARVLPERCQARLDVLRDHVEAAYAERWYDRAQWALMGAAATSVVLSIVFVHGVAR